MDSKAIRGNGVDRGRSYLDVARWGKRSSPQEGFRGNQPVAKASPKKIDQPSEPIVWVGPGSKRLLEGKQPGGVSLVKKGVCQPASNQGIMGRGADSGRLSDQKTGASLKREPIVPLTAMPSDFVFVEAPQPSIHSSAPTSPRSATSQPSSNGGILAPQTQPVSVVWKFWDWVSGSFKS